MNRRMISSLLSALLLPACAGEDAAFDEVDSREEAIVGGAPVRIQDAPWMVELFHPEFGHTCGGAIIDEHHVLSARHCFNAGDGNAATLGSPKSVRVLAGVSDLTQRERGQIVDIDDVVPLVDGYDGNVVHGKDIVLLRLAKPLRWSSKVQPIQVATLDDVRAGLVAPGKTARATGWGLIAEEGPGSEKLLGVDLKIAPLSEIVPEPGDFVSQTDILAAGGEPGKDTCVGDSGGPLVVRKGNRHILVGLTSFGLPPCGGGRASGFTNVAVFAEALEHALCEEQRIIKKKSRIAGTIGTENMQFFAIDVPAGQRQVNFNLFGGTGDVDMYIKKGARPSETSFDCKSTVIGSNDETCNFGAAAPGRYWIGLLGFEDYADVKLQVNGYSGGMY